MTVRGSRMVVAVALGCLLIEFTETPELFRSTAIRPHCLRKPNSTRMRSITARDIPVRIGCGGKSYLVNLGNLASVRRDSRRRGAQASVSWHLPCQRCGQRHVLHAENVDAPGNFDTMARCSTRKPTISCSIRQDPELARRALSSPHMAMMPMSSATRFRPQCHRHEFRVSNRHGHPRRHCCLYPRHRFSAQSVLGPGGRLTGQVSDAVATRRRHCS